MIKGLVVYSSLKRIISDNDVRKPFNEDEQKNPHYDCIGGADGNSRL